MVERPFNKPSFMKFSITYSMKSTPLFFLFLVIHLPSVFGQKWAATVGCNLAIHDAGYDFLALQWNPYDNPKVGFNLGINYLAHPKGWENIYFVAKTELRRYVTELSVRSGGLGAGRGARGNFIRYALNFTPTAQVKIRKNFQIGMGIFMEWLFAERLDGESFTFSPNGSSSKTGLHKTNFFPNNNYGLTTLCQVNLNNKGWALDICYNFGLKKLPLSRYNEDKMHYLDCGLLIPIQTLNR
jgi:hypothetical protein